MQRTRSCALKPPRRTPRVCAWFSDQPVPYRVRANIIQPGQIGFLLGEQSIPILEPDRSTEGAIQLTDMLRRDGVQMLHESSQGGRLARLSDKVVVIRENGPSLQFPVVLAGERQQGLGQVRQTLRVMKVMRPVVSSCADDVSPRIVQPMRRRVWPIRSGAF
jgi:hypothetical protein